MARHAIVIISALALVGCGSTKSGGHGSDASAGTGGVASNGGMIGTGGVLASGGITGPGGGGGHMTGGTGAGGAGTGGVTFGGNGGRSSGGTGGTHTPDAGCTGASCTVDSGVPDAALPACSQLTSQTACDLRGDCHAVFATGASCSCDGGACCMQFSRCADGGKADCAGPALCKSMTPDCPAPYAVGYTGSCYEGCVRQSACPAPTCPASAPTNATACGPVDYTCFYETCATTGRTLATCSGGTWKIETAACTAIQCSGGGINPTGLTCDPGMACVVVTSTGGAYMVTPMCVQPTCGTGPVTGQCIPSIYGSCATTTGLSGITVRCSYSSCGSGQGGCA